MSCVTTALIALSTPDGNLRRVALSDFHIVEEGTLGPILLERTEYSDAAKFTPTICTMAEPEVGIASRLALKTVKLLKMLKFDITNNVSMPMFCNPIENFKAKMFECEKPAFRDMIVSDLQNETSADDSANLKVEVDLKEPNPYPWTVTIKCPVFARL